MSTLISTDQVSAADRLDFVRQLTADTWVPMECRPGNMADCWGEFRRAGLGAMQVVVMDVMPITVCRTPELISQVDPDLLKVLLVCGGSSVVEQGGQQARLSAGEFAFYDTRRPYVVACGWARTGQRGC
jgi:AraC-binding-like domain